MDDKALARQLRRQEGVVTRQQLRECGVSDSDVERMIRRRELTRIGPRLFVNHTGALTWDQRAWAAVLSYAPAALAGRSALQAHGLRGHDRGKNSPIVVCVDRTRSIRRRPGVHVLQLKDFEARSQMSLSPPRLRVEHALLWEASAQEKPVRALAILADAVQQGATTPGRLADALALHPVLRHRQLLLEILRDVARGAYSVLEQRYLVDVERPHGLPTADRQRRVKPGRTVAYRDVDYVELGTGVELDGRIGHEDALDRWADLDRDLDAVTAGQLTLRAGWAQVLEPCRLAIVVGDVLTARGWSDQLTSCGPDCLVADRTTGLVPGT